MNRLIKDKLKEINEICERFDVRELYVFGSATTEKFNNNSDIDILVYFKDLIYILAL